MKIEQDIKQGKFEDGFQKALINLIYTGNWFRDKQNNIFKSYNLLPQHYNILRILKGKHPNPVSPGEIKEVMLDKGNDLTRLLDKLVNQNIVKRSLCEENRRKIDLVLTKEGLELLEKMEAPVRALHSEIKKQMTEEEAETLSDLLDKLRY